MESLIHIEDLTHYYAEVRALNQLSLDIRRGEIFGFLGHNGAGKTTTIRILNGVLPAQSGTVNVFGLNPNTDGASIRARTGVLTETPALDERLTARENLRIYANLYNVPAQQVNERVDTMLKTFDLHDRAGEKVGGYSKGMKQRLALARAFLHQPEILFLDEPTSGLDPVSAHQLHEVIEHMSREEGRTVFLCTHNLTEAARLCDRVGVMEKGHLVALGTPAELAHQTQSEMRYEVEIAPAQKADAAQIALKTEGISRLMDSDAAHLVAAVRDREVIPALLTALTGQGIRVYEVGSQAPSLEDIYLAIHSRQDRG